MAIKNIEKDLMEISNAVETDKTVGRKKNSLTPGSFGHRLSLLLVSGYFLLNYEEHTLPNVYTEVNRFEANNLNYEFSVKVCIGFENGLQSLPFKFIKVKRI